jgi:hypothetical protein
MNAKPLLISLLALAAILPCRAEHFESVPNPYSEPLPVVDIRDDQFNIVAHLYVPPGETMQLDSHEKPVGGAGYYEAMPGADYFLIIPSQSQLPRLGVESCPCLLHMDKIAWNRTGAVTAITGLRPYLQTSSGTKIAIASDVNHLHIADGRVYFKLQGHGSEEYWVQIRYGQVADAGGPWGFWNYVHLVFIRVLPWLLIALLAISVVNAIRLLREDRYPDKSFIELVQFSLARLLTFWRKKRDDEEEWEE